MKKIKPFEKRRTAEEYLSLSRKHLKHGDRVLRLVYKGFYYHSLAVSCSDLGRAGDKIKRYKLAAKKFVDASMLCNTPALKAYASQYEGYALITEAGCSTGKSKAKTYLDSSRHFRRAGNLFTKAEFKSEASLCKGWAALALACHYDACAASGKTAMKKRLYEKSEQHALSALKMFRRLGVEKLANRSKSLELSSEAWLMALKGETVSASKLFKMASDIISENSEWRNMHLFLLAWSKWFSAVSHNSKSDFSEAGRLFGECGCVELKNCCDRYKGSLDS